MRLLFVEDNPGDVELSVAELRRFGFELEHERVDTLDELAAAVERGAFSAVISDFDLGSFDGRDALEVVRQRDREIPFILLSGLVGEELAVDIIRAGANDFVSKDRIARLGSALERELRDVQLRQERRTLFSALRRSEDRYRRIFENVRVGVAVTTPDGTLITANESFSAILGERAQEIVQQLLAGAGQTFERREHRFVRDDGRQVWAAISASPITTDSFELEQIVWLVEDVTGPKQYEMELRSQKAQLEQAQRMAHIGSYELDLLTGKRTWSGELYRIFGLDPELGPDVAAADARVHPDDVEHVRRARDLVVQMQEPFNDEYRIVLPDGSVRLVNDYGHFLFDDDGRAVKIVGLAQDITETRQQQEELQRRSLQQVVIANLGHAALSGEPIDALLAEATSIVSDLLNVELAAVMQENQGTFRVVSQTGWGDALPRDYELSAVGAAQSKYSVENRTAVIVDDVRTETRFEPSPFLLSHGIVSVVTVPISTARTAPWGVVGAFSRTRREFTASDVDFLRSIATVMAQALERDRVDQQLVLHAAQQSAIAELSRVALRSVDDAIDAACNIVSDVLNVDHALFFELEETTQVLHYRAGRCWVPVNEMNLLVAGNAEITAAVQNNATATLGPIGEGLAGGIAVPVASEVGRYGVITAHTKRARTFVEADVEFIQSIANIIADAMERERARRALSASEERNREVIEGATEIIFTISVDGRFTSLNAAFTNITGWRADEWIGRPFEQLVHPDDAPHVHELFEVLLARQESVNTEVRILGRAGTLVLDISSFPKIENGRTAAIYGFARDITDARRVERERHRLTRNLQLLLESTVEGILTVDLAGRCTLSNRAAAEMLGREQEEMQGATLQTLLNGDERAAIGEIIAVVHSGEVRSVVNGTFWRADGTQFPVEYSAAPIIDAGVRIGVVISFSDITERRKLEVKLEQADRLSSLGRLAATIAHEFNNVLMGISPFVEVIRRGRNIETSLDHIGRAVKRGKRITQDILRFTQPAQPVRTSIDMGPWIENVALEARSLMHGCTVLSSVARGLRIDGDPTQLQQIFTNLILNARDAMPDGGTLTIDVRHEPPNARLPFAVDRPERFAHVVVRDTGCGMSAETQRHIFEPLFTTKRNGTGLGLPVTHQVVQRHGGDIFVESVPGVGTTFHIFLPLAEESVEARVTELAHELQALHGAHRVLLVEDDVSVAAGLVSLLELEGLHVEVATTGEEALRRVEQVDPDVVVLDVGLPDMDGTSVYTALAERYPDLPIVFSTGHADKGKIDSLLERPHVAFLLKPYESSALLGAIREVMS
jgi:PAS domain S-box-containing protein